MNRFLTLFIAALMTQASMAIPARRVVRTVTQPDGTTLEVVLQGDETFHFYTTVDGKPVRQDADGRWVDDVRDVASIWQKRFQQREMSRRPHAEKMRRMMRSFANQRSHNVKAAAGDVPSMQKRGLLILVNFKDKSLVTTASLIHDTYDKILNGEGVPYGNNYGSVHEYFLAQSYGALDVKFDIMGPVTLKNEMKYYGQDVDDNGNPSSASKYEGNDAHPGEMVKEALEAIKTQVNFADYDWDGDGEVENVYVIYAGYGQASGATSNTIWPHQWNLSEATGSWYTYNGVKIDTYACGSELTGVSGSTLDGIGTMCHEYSHCLGLPDFYDTSGENNFGMSTWSLMDYGCYNNDGFCPAGYTAYERWYSGWLEPTELSASATVTDMQPIETTPEAYIIYNDANKNEYYLLANHQQVGWDSQAYGHGMLVLHVDYDGAIWAENTVNNTTSRQRMTIIPADNKALALTATNYMAWSRSLAGDPWPGTSSSQDLTDESTPKASLYRVNTDGQKLMHKPITHITEEGGLVSFDFMNGAPVIEDPTPDAEVADIGDSAFTASWTEVEGAESYNLRYRQVIVTETEDDDDAILEYCVMYEDFEKFLAEKDGTTDLSNRLDEYTSYPGWSGYKVYEGIYGAKLGTAKLGGSLTTPLMEDLTSGQLSMYLFIPRWENANGKADNTTVEVVLLDAQGRELESVSTAPDDEYLVDVQFENVPSEASICIRSNAGNNRFYLAFMLVADGDMEVLDALYDYIFFSEEDEDDYDEDYGDEFDWNDFWNDFFVKNKAYLRQHIAAHHRAGRRNATTTTYGEWVEIDGITSNRYTLTDLEYAGLYEYQVQAVDADGNTSHWSAIKLVQLSGTVGIATVNGEVGVENGQWYDLGGRRVTSSSALPKGIYVVDGRKVVVK